MLSGEIDVYKQRAGDLQHYTSADIALFPGSHAWAENLGMRLVLSILDVDLPHLVLARSFITWCFN